MAKQKEVVKDEAAEAVLRVYEAGYQISPLVKEEDLDKVVGDVRSVIEKAGGSFISEAAPAMTRLAYGIPGKEGGKTVLFDRAYFGWLKFESGTEASAELARVLKAHPSVIRSIVFRTVREDTRAKFKAGLREVKRGDTIRSGAKRPEEVSAPVSEVDLDKAISGLTSE